ncbi:ngfi-a-binding protein 1-like [Gigaspora margarita]|uniref:Ngfi-a-binding protein 1-like n=1 Tax=Gigaspora margarita TaxID=4874 RepID=A0A8H4EIS9_GIGMA|nr:ngfi-a-binding protein 1-like [Gigaspora margarita]
MEPTPASTQEETLPEDSPPNSHPPPGYYLTNQFPPLTSTSNSTYRYPTLTAFLHQLNLYQYHNLFVEAGVGENDLEQFIGFDESELKEVLSAISMKPFHSAAFKKGIRELRQTLSASPSSMMTNHSTTSFTSFSSPPLEPNNRKLNKVGETTDISYPMRDKASMVMETPPMKVSPNRTGAEESAGSPMHEIQEYSVTAMQDVHPISSTIPSSITNSAQTTSKDVIIHHATIYGKNNPRKLTTYEQAINHAAIELALLDPALVANKGTLFEKAKEKLLLEGYTYKRGQSRSKLNPNAPKPGVKTSRASLIQKRNAHAAQNSESRNARISELERKLQVKDTQYAVTQEFKRLKTGDADSLEKVELTLEEVEKERAEIAKELSILKSKERKHRWYEQKKKERMDSGFEEADVESLNNNNNEL